MPYDPAFPHRIEYPKWVHGVLVADAAEERAVTTAAAEVMAIQTAAKSPLPTLAKAIANPEPMPARATPLEPEPACPASSTMPMCPTPSNYQKLADIPEPEFEAAVTAPGPKPTTRGIIAAEPARPPASTTMAQARPSPPPGTSASGHPPSSSGERMRRMRERQRGGRRAVMLHMSAGQIEALILAGVLDPASQGDVVEIADALGRLLDHAARSGPAL